MLIYTVNVIIDQTIEKDWLQWMQSVHIPEVMQSKCFKSAEMAIRTDSSEQNPHYEIRYYCEDVSIFENYQKNHAPALQKDHTEKYKGKFKAYRALSNPIFSM